MQTHLRDQSPQEPSLLETSTSHFQVRISLSLLFIRIQCGCRAVNRQDGRAVLLLPSGQRYRSGRAFAETPRGRSLVVWLVQVSFVETFVLFTLFHVFSTEKYLRNTE